ncbi:MAG: malto-oligosyltrehalose synthase [Rhodospirillales bacterium 20-60-12]|nr:MAG: malto-oligosyltrehalose synthase [Rhodospirillales bacterium 20-60-12]HQT67311.1 malto-oligosyltrehalose synthase [Acetobacteraceae bacterium]
MTLSTIPRATYRLQLHAGFTFDDAARIVPYLAALGVSHAYTSPILTARPGSTHGYDIVDHRAINPELGGEPAFRRFVAALRAQGMGIIVDIVPNHMGVGGADNGWWLDLLEWGQASRYANFFDIDWTPPDPALNGKILAPFLGAPYGECLDAGEIKLKFDAATGSIAAHYGEHVLPITPPDYPRLLPGLLPPWHAARHAGRQAARIKADLLSRDAGLIDAALARFDPATETGRAQLHALLERQHYRLAWWRAAADEINWRRFFDVTSLAGLRVELPAVFDATHELLLRLYGEGLIDGMRIDHVDGLADPRAYCRKLRRSLHTAGASRPADAPAGEPYILVEKILAAGEFLPADWLTDGTTGYDFMDQVGGLLHDPEGAVKLAQLWSRLTGRAADFEVEEREARRLTLRDALASELNAAAAALHRIARRDLVTRDFTLTTIRRALTEILIHFPVYRLYAGSAGRTRPDDHVLARAMAGARRSLRAADHPLLALIGDWLGGKSPHLLPPGPARRGRLRAMVRFQQLSSPVAAKSVEDTAFYRYGRLLSRNEVGSNPGVFALTPAGFHAACQTRQRHTPHAMLATATHDHKRGEDVRARLAVISEIPDEWEACLERWMRMNAALHRTVDPALGADQAPDPADEIMLYQMLVGAWPLGLAADDEAGLAAFRSRIAAWQVKALREAKLHTGWIAPDEAYEAACADFLAATLDPQRAAPLCAELAAFAARIAPAGALNGLAQTVLRLTVPGMPDQYQGTEYWDESLVDPDNRSAVDYPRRADDLAHHAPLSALLADWRSGRIKQAITAELLALRRLHAASFASGSYVKLDTQGPLAGHVLAFARIFDDQMIITAVTRLACGLLGTAGLPLVPRAAWAGTHIIFPDHLAGRTWRSLFDPGHPIGHSIGHSGAPDGRILRIETLFAQLPAALLIVV